MRRARSLAPLAWLGLMLAAMTWVAGLHTPTASAHASRVSAEPADNATVTAGPAQVSATFNERLQTTFAAMVVIGPDGNLWSTGEPTVQGAVVTVALRPLGPTGSYTVNYRVTSADGHVVSGSWSFRLTVPGTGSPGPPIAAPNPDDGPPAWPFAVAAIAVVAVGAVWAMRHRR